MSKVNSKFYLERFNDTIQQWIDNLDHYSLAMLLQKPADKSWSLGQVYMHIFDDTHYFAEQIRLALKTNDNTDKPMHEDAIMIFKNDGFPDIKIVNTTAGQPLQPFNIAALKDGLNSIKQEIAALVQITTWILLKAKPATPACFISMRLIGSGLQKCICGIIYAKRKG